jgi:hypothetical protein
MPANELHHGYTLTSLFIEAKFAKDGRSGEASGGSWIQDARKAYNKAHRKACRMQLSRYQAPVEDIIFEQVDDNSFFDWCDLITEADAWYEAKRFDNWV